MVAVHCNGCDWNFPFIGRIPEKSIPHPRRELEILEGRRVREQTKLQSLYERKLEVPGGRGPFTNSLCVGGMDIF